MTVDELIKKLEKIPKQKIVILTDPDGKGWDNVGKIIEADSCVKITISGNVLFNN